MDIKVGDKVIMTCHPISKRDERYPNERCCIGDVVTIVEILSGVSWDYTVKCNKQRMFSRHGIQDIHLVPSGIMSEAIYGV